MGAALMLECISLRMKVDSMKLEAGGEVRIKGMNKTRAEGCFNIVISILQILSLSRHSSSGLERCLAMYEYYRCSLLPCERFGSAIGCVHITD